MSLTGLNYRNRFSILGASVRFYIPPPPPPIWLHHQAPMLDLGRPFVVFGAQVYLNKEWPPNVRFPVVIPPWVAPPDIYLQKVPAPQQFSTNDGTIQGVVDGVNRIFTVGAYLHRAQVAVNGVYQTQNWDYAFGGTALIFMPISIPPAGAVVTISGWGNW